MTPWQASDGVGAGAIYLPDNAARDAYGAACRAAVVDIAARHAIGLPSLEHRRSFIDNYPANMRDELKDRISKLWLLK